MGEFKKGDFVRRTSGSSLYTSAGRHEAGFVGQVSDVKFRGGTNDIIFTNGHEGIAQNYEPWQPRVGERVRTISGGDFEYIGVEGIIEANDGATDRNLMVKLDKPIEKWGDTKIWRSAHHLEPILTTNTPEPPATLKIEAGKFYKTRDGRKVGPAFISGTIATFGSTSNHASAVWSDDGRSSNRDDKTSLKDKDIIAEWIDEPAAKAEASNDNAQPKFKIGDAVKHPEGQWSRYYPVTKIENGKFWIEVLGKPFHFSYDMDACDWLVENSTSTSTTPTTTIVALIENGQPKPSSTPHVHTSTGSAEKEAKRLAGKYKGQQFGVFTLTTTHEEAAPVYYHKWQNLAALGLKIDAIKELRAVAGLTLRGAKDAVEAWVDYQDAA